MICKLLKYFVILPLDRIFFYLSSKLRGIAFVRLFNLYSFLNNSKNKINFKDNKYFCTERNWIFYHEKIGLYAYGKGFEKRKKELRISYHLDKIDFQNEDVIIDIGANNGDLYLNFNDQINYYGFEPSPIVFSNLKHNIKNQKLFQKGLWNKEDKKIDFYLSDQWGDSSILEIKKYLKKISIETTTLSKIITEIDKKVKLIKLEAEGAEPEILDGLGEKIDMVEYISIDCGFERGVQQKSTLAECSNFLINKNYKMIAFQSPRITALFKNKKYN